jgi:hypothetical protein
MLWGHDNMSSIFQVFPEVSGISGLIDIDDSQRVIDTHDLIGAMVLTTLNDVDMVGELRPHSRLRDLALVMAMWVKICYLGPPFMAEAKKWHETIFKYARKDGISLQATPVPDMDTSIAALGRLRALTCKPVGNRWLWRKKVNDLDVVFGTDADWIDHSLTISSWIMAAPPSFTINCLISVVSSMISRR